MIGTEEAFDRFARWFTPDPLEAYDAEDHERDQLARELGEGPIDRVIRFVGKWMFLVFMIGLFIGYQLLILSISTSETHRVTGSVLNVLALGFGVILWSKVLPRMWLAKLEGRAKRREEESGILAAGRAVRRDERERVRTALEGAGYFDAAELVDGLEREVQDNGA